MGEHAGTLRPHGGYRRLRSFQTASIIYDATVSFCNRFVDKRSRTHDQMVQAARSGRQNIAEGSRASATSSTSELHLVNVARASLDELLLDYEDFLRQRNLRTWGKDDPEALRVRTGGRTGDPDMAAYAPWLQHADPTIVANAMICVIHQANYLLDRQIQALEQQFVQEGGYRERLHAARLAERQRRSDPPGAASAGLPPCPQCGKDMVLRMAKKGARAGSEFLGCSAYPECKGTRPVGSAGK